MSGSDPEGKAQLAGFIQALAALGWIEGRNLRMDVRWGGGDANRARIFAKELVALQPDVILSEGGPRDCSVSTGNAHDANRICSSYRPGRGRVHCRTTPSRRKHNRLHNVRIRDHRQDA